MLSRSNPKRVTLSSYEELFNARSTLPPYVPCPSPATAQHGCPVENVPPVQSAHTPMRKQQQQQQNLSLDSPLTDIISQINSNLNRAHSLLTPSKQPARTTKRPNNAKPQHPPSAAPQPLLLQKQISKLQKSIDLLNTNVEENNELRTELTKYKHRPPALTSSNLLPKTGTFSTIGNLNMLILLVLVLFLFMKLFLQFEEEDVVY